MSQSTTPETAARNSASDIVRPLADAQTYKNLLYLLLAFPLGMAYYVVLMLGFTLGVGLSILGIGLGILLGTVLGLRYIASFERWLANTLLGTAIPDPADIEGAGDSIVDTVTAYLRASSTWRGLGFVFLKFWVGILSFVLLVTFLGAGVELLLIPLFPEGVFNVEIAGWVVARSVETTTEQVVAVPAGAVLALVAVHILNAFAGVNASIASSLLGPKTSDASGGTVPEQEP